MDDQHRHDALGIHRDVVQTPHLDSLARGGIDFQQAVCQCPMCIPSRNSMMYGLYPSQLGVRTNSCGINREDVPGLIPLPERLRRAGYQTAGFGKTHWSHGWENPHPSARGFEVRAIGQDDSEEARESGAKMMGATHPEALARYNAEIAEYGPGEENPAGYLGRTSALPEADHRDGWISSECVNWIESGGIDSGRPLFLYLSFMKPHAAYNIPAGYEERYNLDDIPHLPEPPWPMEAERNSHVSPQREAGFLHNRRTAMTAAWQKLTQLERKQSTLRYFANISWIDDLFGRTLTALKNAGALNNALIVYVSDHGEMMGERHHRFSKYCLYESSVRVPLILSGSYIPHSRRSTVNDQPAQLTDLVPTLLAAAGQPADPTLPGTDLLAPFNRNGAFCELHGSGFEQPAVAPAWMWRSKEWKLILYTNGTVPDPAEESSRTVRGELYNLQADPQEWNNLFEHPDCQTVRNQMTQELLMHTAFTTARYPGWVPKNEN